MPSKKNWRTLPRRPESHLGALVRDARERMGLTQHELAVAIGTQGPFISKIEQGKVKQPALHFLHPLAEALGLPYGALYKAATGEELPGEVALPPDIQAFVSWLLTLEPEERPVVYRIAQAAAAVA